MKTKIAIFSAAFALSQSFGLTAFAQSPSTMATTASAPGSNAAAGQSVTNAAAVAPQTRPLVGLSYLGILFGPNLSDGLEGRQFSGAEPSMSHRPNVRFNFNETTSAGIQARYVTNFSKANAGVTGANDNWRLYFGKNNIASSGIFNLSFMGRAVLPFSPAAHNRRMLPSPELMPTLSITPKNSRFSFSYTPQAIPFLYSDKATARFQKAPDFYIVHNIEGAYTLGSKTQITFAYYPEYLSTYAAAFTNSSNEVDVGINWDFMKGWSINPVVATEMNGLGANGAALTKNMQVNVSLSGQFL